MSQGYFLIALGKRYIDECKFLLNTIKKSNDNRPVSLLIHAEDENYAREVYGFDQLIHFTPSGKLWEDCETAFEKYCLYPRINFPNCLPYDETIIVDSDVLCQHNPESVWNFMSSQDCPVRMLGRLNDPNWHWGHINEVSKAFGKHVPHVHGGFFYLRKSGFLNTFFEYCISIFYKYDEYKCKRMFRGGRVDEIIFAIAHSNFDIDPIPFDSFPVMTFNYDETIQIPSKLQTEGNQNIKMQDYIPFVHMFDKMEGDNFKKLYGKIIHGI